MPNNVENYMPNNVEINNSEIVTWPNERKNSKILRGYRACNAVHSSRSRPKRNFLLQKRPFC